MIQEVKLRKIGNSVGIVLSKEVLARMHAKDGDSIYITESTDGGIRLSAYNPEFAKKMELADGLISRYRNALNKLAK